MIGVLRNTSSGSSCKTAIMDSFEFALRTLSSAGANIVDNTDFSAAEEFKKLNQQVKGIIRSSEFKRDIFDYLTTLETNPNDIHSVGDIISFTKTCPAENFAVIPSRLGVANDLAAKMVSWDPVPLRFYPEGTPIQHDNGDLVTVVFEMILSPSLNTSYILLARLSCIYKQVTSALMKQAFNSFFIPFLACSNIFQQVAHRMP